MHRLIDRLVGAIARWPSGALVAAVVLLAVVLVAVFAAGC